MSLEQLTDGPEMILGQDFLTCIWFKGEHGNGMFRTHGKGEAYTVSMEQRVVVRGGDGENLETASVSGAMSLLREARLGLAVGKKVVRALIRLEKDELSWQLTLKAEDFALNGLRTPALAKKEEDDDPDASLLEKMYLIEQCLALIDDLYRHFLALRLNSQLWAKECRELAAWIQSGSNRTE